MYINLNIVKVIAIYIVSYVPHVCLCSTDFNTITYTIALVSHTIRLGLKHTQFKHFEKINTDMYRRPSYRSRC